MTSTSHPRPHYTPPPQTTTSAGGHLLTLTPPCLQLPVFDGSGLVNQFLECYEGSARVQQLSDQHKIDTLFTQLCGEAADWYAQATQTAPQMWQEVALLVDQFHPLDYAAHNIATLYLQKKKDNEHLRKYWKEKLYIANGLILTCQIPPSGFICSKAFQHDSNIT